MSGGVDSSVAAYLLKEQGYNVVGLTMRLSESFNSGDESGIAATAHAVANKLGIDFMVNDYRDEFQDFVVDPFVRTYEEGKTPNPCIECNRCIKFDLLVDDSDEGYAMDMENAPLLATGHYAIIEAPDASCDIGDALIEQAKGRWKLRKSTNLAKDQSYFLYTLNQNTLSRVIFPLGRMDKEDVRKIAASKELLNARKKDSQDICFIPNGRHGEFIKGYTGKDYPEGDFVDMDGNVLGRHKGIINYTIGQRKGLGLALKKPMYVVRLDVEKNQVILGDDAELFTKELSAENVNWVSIAPPAPGTSFRALGRIRYRHEEQPCTVTVTENGELSVVFDEAQRAITAGQSLVLYDIETDSYVLGGGIIK